MKLLIGGSPCTHWSIAQTKNRETEASGIGWELFLNYRIGYVECFTRKCKHWKREMNGGDDGCA